MTKAVPMIDSCEVGIGTPTVAWMSKSPQPLPPAKVGVITQALLVNGDASIGACTPRKAEKI